MQYAEIGRRIREERVKQHYTQETLAEAAEISLSFMGHIERGTRKMSLETFEKICKALHCSADKLLATGLADEEVQRSATEILKQALLLAEYAPKRRPNSI